MLYVIGVYVCINAYVLLRALVWPAVCGTHQRY